MKLPWKRRSKIVYETILKEFDREFYLKKYPDVARAKVNPVRHYIHSGVQEGRDPSPDFSTRFYLESYPEVAASGVNPFYHYLTTGRAEGRIATAFQADSPQMQIVARTMGLAPVDAAAALKQRQDDVRQRLSEGVLGDMVAHAAGLDPLIHHPPHEWLEPEVPPFRPSTVFIVEAMQRLQEMAQMKRASTVVVMPHCRISGAARVAGELAFALAAKHGPEQVVVVRTDLSALDYPEWFPAGCRHVDFASVVGHLNDQECQTVLFHFLRSLGPDHVFNVNSRLFWEMSTAYGAILSATVPTYCYLFCSEQNDRGQETGYPISYFYRCFADLTGFITDSSYLAETLRERFHLRGDDADKIVTLATPIRDVLDIVPRPDDVADRRPRIFWAGRFDQQKRVDIVLALARRMPELDFFVWGKAVIGSPFDLKNEDLPANFLQQGLYEKFSDLPLERCDLWLYTAQWDGVPTILLDVAAAGVPLVASLIGGTGDVLLEDLCHRIADIDDVDAFEAAVRAVLADPATARDNACRMREDILAQRPISRYRTDLETFLKSRERHDRH